MPQKSIIQTIVEAIGESDEGKLEKILSDKNIDLNQELDGTYALHVSIGNLECVKVLLQHGATPNVIDKEGKQPIHLAVERDFVETLMYLVLHGADYDAKTRGNDDTNGMTPLQIAVKEDAFSCQDFLHFLGAEIPSESLDNNFKLNYDIIHKGFTEGQIVGGGKAVPVNRQQPEYVKSLDGRDVGIGFQGNDKPFVIFIRKLGVEYQSSSTRIPEVPIDEGMELVSDIYQYRVDKDVVCDIHISGMEGFKPDKYNKLVVKHMTDFTQTSNEFTNVDIVDKKVIIKKFTLCAYGSSPTASFGILTSIKTDEFRRDPNKALTVNSTVEELFSVSVPAGTAPEVTKIQMKVLKSTNESRVENSSDSIDDDDSDFGNSSDFLSVDSDNTQNSNASFPNSPSNSSRQQSIISSNSQNELNIQLPRPIDQSGKIQIVLKSPKDRDCTESDSWEEHKTFEVSGKVMKCKKASFANYIVVNVKKIGPLVKEFVSFLYTRALGDKKVIKLFAMVKQVGRFEYLVKIVMCESDFYPKRLQECLKDNFKEQECGPTDEFEINTKRTFMLKLKLKNAHADVDILPIQFQSNKPKSQIFAVDIDSLEESKTASGLCLMFKKDVPKNESLYGKKCITTLAVRFGSCKTKTIPPELFLSDKFIQDVARRTIGLKWFSLGIHLGFSCEELFALQDIDPYKRNEMILYKWRDEQPDNSRLDVKLDNMIVATKAAELPNLKSIICAAAFKFRQNNSVLASWIHRYQRTDRDSTLDLASLQPKRPSPLSDTFLLFIAEQLGGIDNRLFFELDLTVAELEDTRMEPTYRRCKHLMLARDKASSSIELYKKLKKALSKLDLSLPWLEISDCANTWLNSREAKNENARDSLQKIFT